VDVLGLTCADVEGALAAAAKQGIKLTSGAMAAIGNTCGDNKTVQNLVSEDMQNAYGEHIAFQFKPVQGLKGAASFLVGFGSAEVHTLHNYVAWLTFGRIEIPNDLPLPAYLCSSNPFVEWDETFGDAYGKGYMAGQSLYSFGKKVKIAKTIFFWLRNQLTT
jgi:hypothetical protein